jgi:magnesium transporter
MSSESQQTAELRVPTHDPYQAMIMQCVAYRQGQRIGTIDLEAISDVLQQEDTFVWLGLREANQGLLDKIQKEFGLHELAVEDTRSAHQRPKLEEYGGSLFMVLHTAQIFQNAVRMGETHVFIGPKFLVTVRHGSSLSYHRVRERCEAMPQNLAQGPGFALYSIMDFIIDNYVPVVDALEDRLERLEADIFRHKFNRETLEQLYQLKRELLELRNATTPLLDICNQLMRFHENIVPRAIEFYFRDVYDHVRRINESINSMMEMLTSAMQVHLALVTVGQNEIVKRLAGWGAILAIPTMLFSLYGMNFHYMPELNWPFGYPVLMGSVAVSCFWLYWRLRKYGWL